MPFVDRFAFFRVAFLLSVPTCELPPTPAAPYLPCFRPRDFKCVAGDPLLIPFSYPTTKKEIANHGIRDRLLNNCDGARAGIKLFTPHLPLQLCTKLLFHHQNKAYLRCILAKKPDIKTLEEAWWSFVRLFLVKRQKEIASLYRQYQFKPTPGPRY